MRLDKFLCDGLGISRTEAKKMIQKGKVFINDTVASKPDMKVDENSDFVTCDDKPVIFEEFVYYMLNKPAGVVCANHDSKESTVLDLFKDLKRRKLSCVGRLDKDTTGLLILTDDGNLIHALTSPQKKVYKEYLVGIDHPLSEADIKALEEGVDIGDDRPTLPSKVCIKDDKTIVLSICEGRFHQVKRMLIAVGNEVLSLKRISEGKVRLDEGLKPGEYRRLTEDEIRELKR